MSCKCHSCKKQYTADLIIPDDIWVMVYREDHAKAKDGGGLLCPHCIIDRIQDVCTFSVMMLTTQRTTQIKENEMETTTFEAPTKPLPDLEVDAKVLVWNDTHEKNRRHFSHFSNGRIYTFDNGTTSFTRLHAKSMTGWPYWELAE